MIFVVQKKHTMFTLKLKKKVLQKNNRKKTKPKLKEIKILKTSKSFTLRSLTCSSSIRLEHSSIHLFFIANKQICCSLLLLKINRPNKLTLIEIIAVFFIIFFGCLISRDDELFLCCKI